jgi:septum formation protein
MSFWLVPDPLVLASKSAVRKALLVAAGVQVAVQPADIDERKLEERAPTQAPDAIALWLAGEKAAVAAQKNPGRLVLGADQTLAVGTRRFSKPPDPAAAREQLRVLRGRTHELHAAIVFAQDGAVLFEHVDVVRLTMRAFSERFLDLYMGAVGSAVTASVGAYQLEGPGIQLFERIDGDYFTVLGLPLLPALDFLRRRGCLAP